MLLAALVVLAVSWPAQRRWTRRDLGLAAVFGVATAVMNLCFYLAIDRVALGKGVVIEFIGPIVMAAALTRTRRNTLALVLAVGGVAVLSGVEIDREPLGLAFILAASTMWAAYIVVGRRVADLDRGLSGLGVGLLVGAAALTPVGAPGSGHVLTSGRLLVLCLLVAVLSSAIGYCDRPGRAAPHPRAPVRGAARAAAGDGDGGRPRRALPAADRARPRRRGAGDRRRGDPGPRRARRHDELPADAAGTIGKAGDPALFRPRG